MVIVGTGHRPPGCVPAGEGHKAYRPWLLERLADLAQVVLEHEQPDTVVSGAQQGWDWALALAAQRLSLPYHLVVPFHGFASNWPRDTHARWRDLLQQAQLVTFVYEGMPDSAEHAVRLLHERNDRLLDYLDPVSGDSGFVAALWSGTAQGGTYSAVIKARTRGLVVKNYWRSWEKHRY
jgi:hypothetical protein